MENVCHHQRPALLAVLRQDACCCAVSCSFRAHEPQQVAAPFQDVKLWDAMDLSKPPELTLSGYRGGHFSASGRFIAACTSYDR